MSLENIDKPTEKDSKKIEEVRLIPYKTTDKNGTINYGKMCRKCGNTVLLKRPVLGASIEGFTTK